MNDQKKLTKVMKATGFLKEVQTAKANLMT